MKSPEAPHVPRSDRPESPPADGAHAIPEAPILEAPILEAISQGVAVWNADHKLAAFNRRYVALMGLPPDFVHRGVAFADVIRRLAERGHFGPGADPDACVEMRVARARLHTEQRHVRYLPDGRVLEVQRRPLPGGGFVSTFTDITEVKRAEEDVEHKSNLLSATLNVMGEGLAIFDRNLKLQMFNDAFVSIFRYPPGFVTLGMTYEQVLSYSLMQQIGCSVDRAREIVRDRIESAQRGEPSRVTHMLQDGTYIAITRDALPNGGFVATYADITERVNASIAVKKSSALLAATQENMVQGVIVYDADFRIINLNRRFLELYDLPEDVAYIGADFCEVLRFRARRGDFGPGDPEALANIRIRRHKDPTLRNFQHRTQVGWTILMLRSPLEDGGWVMTCTDVTEQRRAEHKIRGHAALLRSTFEALSHGVVAYDAEFRITAWNKRYVEIFGFPPGFIHTGRTRDEVIRYLAQRGEFGAVPVEEFVRQKRESAVRNEHYHNEYVRADGTALATRREPMPGGGCVTTVADVSRRRAREERLRESEERYALAMKGSNEGLWDWNLPRGEVYLSPRVREIANLDFLAPTISDRRWPALVHPDDLQRYQAAVRAHFVGETEFLQCEYRIRGADGRYRWILDRGLALRGEDGRVHRMAGSIGDISARKDAERKMLEAKEAAEHASRAKTDFLANVSHELRTPLNAIIGFSEVMREELFGPIGNRRYHEYLRDIHQSGTHLLSLINDILDVAKAEAGKIELTEEVVDVRDILESSVHLVGDRAVQEKLTIAVDLDPHLPMLWADERKVRQIVLNLLTNSIKFTPPGGTVTVLGRSTAGGGLAVVVADTGIGIAAHDIAKVLSPFGQVDSSLARKHTGTGLGLPLCQALAEAHGGALRLASEIGKGTTVTITFPPARIRQAGSDAAKGSAAAGR